MPTEIAAEIDETDPLVSIICWVLTSVVAKATKKNESFSKIRHWLPAISLVIAIVCRSLVDAFEQEPLTTSTFVRALGSAAVAVLAHSQFREVQKLNSKSES